MIFNIREWREIYDMVHKMGKMLKDSRPRIDSHKICHPAVHELSVDTQKNLECEIKAFMDKSDRYLELSGVKCPYHLWKFNIKDTKTWPSHKDFKYKHLLK